VRWNLRVFRPARGSGTAARFWAARLPEESAMNLMTSLMVVLAVIALMLIGFGLIPI
jgi:hypothetical protein